MRPHVYSTVTRDICALWQQSTLMFEVRARPGAIAMEIY